MRLNSGVRPDIVSAAGFNLHSQTMLLIFRVLVATAWVIGFIVGFRRYSPSAHLTDARFVTRPEARFWGPFRYLDPGEWTSKGLKWRREAAIYSFIMFLLTVGLILLFLPQSQSP
jgi:hypothetical protein